MRTVYFARRFFGEALCWSVLVSEGSFCVRIFLCEIPCLDVSFFGREANLRIGVSKRAAFCGHRLYD